jgi:outer membrane murein-binding lipoprotein Lpp
MTVKTTISNGDVGLDVRDTLNKALTDITTTKTNVTTVTTDVATVKTDVTTLKSDVTTTKSDVTTLKSDTATAKTDIATLKTDVTTLKSTTVAISTKTASYTLVAADSSTIIEMNLSAAGVLTLPATLAKGFQVIVIVTGAGQITFTPASGATMSNRMSFTKSAGVNAELTLVVLSNTTGTNAKYILGGDGAI